MRDLNASPQPPSRTRHRAAFAVPVAAAALAALTIAAPAGGSTVHNVKLDSTTFAAQVGSLTSGGSVFAGALPDPRLGHGAIVFTTTGTTNLHVTFQEFFALGSIKGAGSVALSPLKGGRQKLAGSLKITSGTGKYRNASGKLTAAGNINTAGMLMATLKGSFTH
jgi:hypothetical protein